MVVVRGGVFGGGGCRRGLREGLGGDESCVEQATIISQIHACTMCWSSVIAIRCSIDPHRFIVKMEP